MAIDRKYYKDLEHDIMMSFIDESDLNFTPSEEDLQEVIDKKNKMKAGVDKRHHYYEDSVLRPSLNFLLRNKKAMEFERMVGLPRDMVSVSCKKARVLAKYRPKIGYYLKPFIVKMFVDYFKKYIANTPNVWEMYGMDVFTDDMPIPRTKDEYAEYLFSLIKKEDSENQESEPKGSVNIDR